MSEQLQSSIIKVINYFSIFDYYPTSEEIYTFLQAKISKNSLKIELDKMIGDKQISGSKDTPPQYSIIRNPKSVIKKLNDYELRIANSKNKLNNWRFRLYIKLLSLAPQIKLIGLSGSISMMNAKEDDDIDLFIITAKNRLFTGRFIALALAQLLGLRRGFQINQRTEYRKSDKTEDGKSESVIRHRSSDLRIQSSDFSDKVCLNLFFDESDLRIPKFKQTEFVGHEVLQMKPIVVKGNIYEKFLKSNLWVQEIFPNSEQVFSMRYKVSSIKNKKNEISILNTKYFILNTLFNKIETYFKKFQLNLINKHRTTEIITATQLWFHPDDYNSFM